MTFLIFVILYSVSVYNIFKKSIGEGYERIRLNDLTESISNENKNLKKNPTSNKITSKAFLDFKKRNKVVHKDVIFKGGFIDFKNGWKYTDSLIIIKRSKNEKKHYLIKKGGSYYTKEGISFRNQDGFGWNTASRDIYLVLDDFQYDEIKNQSESSSWQVRRLGLGDELIVYGSEITYKQEEIDYGVYFIENTFEAYKNYTNNTRVGINEEFVSKKTIYSLFNEKIPENQNFHIVAKGETCYKIAKMYGLRLMDLYRLNPKAKTAIYPGMVLIIKDNTEILENNPTLKENIKTGLDSFLIEKTNNDSILIDESNESKNVIEYKNLFQISSINLLNKKGNLEPKRRKIAYLETCFSSYRTVSELNGNYKFFIRIIDPNGNLLSINNSKSKNKMQNKTFMIFDDSNFGKNGIPISELSSNIRFPNISDICISYYTKSMPKLGINLEEKVQLAPGKYRVFLYIKKNDEINAHFVCEKYFNLEL